MHKHTTHNIYTLHTHTHTLHNQSCILFHTFTLTHKRTPHSHSHIHIHIHTGHIHKQLVMYLAHMHWHTVHTHSLSAVYTLIAHIEHLTITMCMCVCVWLCVLGPLLTQTALGTAAILTNQQVTQFYTPSKSKKTK